MSSLPTIIGQIRDFVLGTQCFKDCYYGDAQCNGIWTGSGGLGLVGQTERSRLLGLDTRSEVRAFSYGGAEEEALFWRCVYCYRQCQTTRFY